MHQITHTTRTVGYTLSKSPFPCPLTLYSVIQSYPLTSQTFTPLFPHLIVQT